MLKKQLKKLARQLAHIEREAEDLDCMETIKAKLEFCKMMMVLLNQSAKFSNQKIQQVGIERQVALMQDEIMIAKEVQVAFSNRKGK